MSDTCQQSAIVPREIAGALEGALGIAEPMKGIPQDFPVFKPCPSMPGRDPKQGLNRPRSVLKAPELELDPSQNQAQLWIGWATLDCRGGNGLGVYVSLACQQEVSQRETGRGDMRFCHDRLSQ